MQKRDGNIIDNKELDRKIEERKQREKEINELEQYLS